MSAVDCTSKKHLVSYRIISRPMWCSNCLSSLCAPTLFRSVRAFFQARHWRELLRRNCPSRVTPSRPRLGSSSSSSSIAGFLSQQRCVRSISVKTQHTFTSSSHAHLHVHGGGCCCCWRCFKLVFTAMRIAGSGVNASITARKDIPYKAPERSTNKYIILNSWCFSFCAVRTVYMNYSFWVRQ